MREKPYLVSAVLGNSRLLATLTTDGEIQRLFWPNVDGGQHVARILGGVALDDGPLLWQESTAWQHRQAYQQDQNILITASVLPGRLEMESIDAAAPRSDLLIRRLRFTNRGEQPVSVRYVLYNWMRFDENPLYNSVLFDDAADGLVHFRRDLFVAAAADRTVRTYSLGDPGHVMHGAAEGRFWGGSVLQGDVAGALQWDLGRLAPGESATLSVFWALGRSAAQVREALAGARTAGADALLEETQAYWSAWLARARPLQVPADAPGVEELYRRSLLVFKLMADEQTGAVIAAPEFDPSFSACGGYAYCWGRDAAFITVAMDHAGYHELARAFYCWAMGAQEPEGWWMHRHYSSGHWGPSWGLVQVDETGSILYGMAVHTRLSGGADFARQVWPSVQRAGDWLVGNMDPETGLPLPSVDLWEERTAELSYSSAAVYAGLLAAAELAELVGEGMKAAQYRVAAAALQEAILREFARAEGFLRGRFLKVEEQRFQEAQAAGRPVRARVGAKGHAIYELAEDPVADVSLLGIAYPFGAVRVDDPVMVRTVQRLVERLWSSVAGGMLRYEGDHYRGGQNPWVLGTLWLGLYEARAGRSGRAREILEWAVARQSETGLLPEQVDPQSGRPVWVLPLTWSHAMYVLLALELYGE